MDAPADIKPQLSPLVVALLRGVVYRDSAPLLWRDLGLLLGPLRDYLAVMGLLPVIDDVEGYAWLRQRQATEDDGAEILPKLIVRRPLSYPVSLLCVLLRKRMLEAEAGSGDPRLVLRRDQIAEMLRTFLPAEHNDAKRDDRIKQHIEKVEELGFLRRLKNDDEAFEVRRILRALVDADWLVDFEQKLAAYRDHAERSL